MLQEKLENIGGISNTETYIFRQGTIRRRKYSIYHKKGFVMEYNATIKVGIDVEAIKVDIKLIR